MLYLFNALKLYASQKITYETLVYALKKRPDAVCGKGGTYGLRDKPM